MTKITEADKKFINKFLQGYPIEDNKTETVTNPFSGANVMVTPLVAEAIGFVYNLQKAMMRGYWAVKLVHPDLKMSNAIMNFDRARMIVLKIDREAYSKILD